MPFCTTIFLGKMCACINKHKTCVCMYMFLQRCTQLCRGTFAFNLCIVLFHLLEKEYIIFKIKRITQGTNNKLILFMLRIYNGIFPLIYPSISFLICFRKHHIPLATHLASDIPPATRTKHFNSYISTIQAFTTGT